VFPVKYELGLYIPEDILHNYGREYLKSTYTSISYIYYKEKKDE
jgi:hypothetical protein